LFDVTLKQPSRIEAPRIAYWGSLGEAWRLALRMTLLTLATLGAYRFWVKATVRRYFWSRITVNDEPLEYAGTGLELFIGFLIVLAIVTPFYGIVIVGQLLLTGDPFWFAASQIAPAFFILALIPIAVFRARRYRLSRTLWRGIRAGQTGTASGYWLRAIGYGTLGWLTLGLLRPLAQVRLTRYLMQNTWFGTTRFAFKARARQLMWRWLVFWVTLIFAYSASMLAIYLLEENAQELAGTDSNAPFPIKLADLWNAKPERIVFNGGLLALIWALSGGTYVWYRINQARIFVGATTLGDLNFASRIRFWRVARIYAIAAVAYVVLVIGASVLSFSLFGPQFGILGVIVVGLLAGALFMPFVTHPLVGHFVETLSVDGALDVDDLVQNTEIAPKNGEGLASVFEVDAM